MFLSKIVYCILLTGAALVSLSTFRISKNLNFLEHVTVGSCVSLRSHFTTVNILAGNMTLWFSSVGVRVCTLDRAEFLPSVRLQNGYMDYKKSPPPRPQSGERQKFQRWVNYPFKPMSGLKRGLFGFAMLRHKQSSSLRSCSQTVRSKALRLE